ncbi:M14 family metallopeptidase [Bacillus sp. JJ1764]|uniref:M14 family metallopeptidase n=1 Tax=Bacillus sp. JJ1764 TaxID=3122964 RepID=UPI002FFD6FE8
MIHPFADKNLPIDSQSLKKHLKKLTKAYPFITISPIGHSVLGHPIHEIRIGHGPKKVHMNASFHANEWITTMVLMNLVNKYLYSLSNGYPFRGIHTAKLFEEVELSIVPMVNPDGVDLVLNGPPQEHKKDLIAINEGSSDFIHWKANIRGIDLNRQFPANWELCQKIKPVTSPASRDYPGHSPLTEPEAIAIYELTKSNDFNRVVAFHTQGEEFYWGYGNLEPPESEQMAREFERVSGYQAIRTIESHAGYKDWFIQEFRRPGFTLELGKGINPLPLSQFPRIVTCVEGIFLAALYC